MAKIDIKTEDGSALGNPAVGNYFIFFDSSNSNKLTTRDNTGADTTYTGGGGGGPIEPLPIITLSSADPTPTFNQSTPLVCAWDIENEKDTGFTHSNITNSSRVTVDADGTYLISGSLRVFNSTDQRPQTVSRILINGVIQPQPYGTVYIRNTGISSDYWTSVVNPPPMKLSANDYVEVQLQIESQITTAVTGTFVGDESSFSVINLQGTKGDDGADGATGAGSNIIVQKNGVTVGTVTDKLNFVTTLAVTDEGSNETEVVLPDMLKIVYDPTGVEADAFDYANAIGITQLTDNIITPSQLLADQDDYNPTGFSTCNMIRQDVNGTRVITGFVAPPVGVNRVFGINNLSTSSNIKFKNNDSGSSAANRLLLRDDGPDKEIKENETAIFWYDHVSLRWRPYNRIG